MKLYAVIHGVCGLYEGYSDTTCEFFPKRGFADKHIAQTLDEYRKDDMCVNIDHATEDAVYVTMDRDPDNYKACVPSDMDHDDYVAENMDDVSVEVFQVIELDVSRYEGSGTTEHMWLTWDQQDCSVAWDYNPLCMSLVARVTSDVMDNTSDDHPTKPCTTWRRWVSSSPLCTTATRPSSTSTTTPCTLSVSPRNSDQ